MVSCAWAAVAVPDSRRTMMAKMEARDIMSFVSASTMPESPPPIGSSTHVTGPPLAKNTFDRSLVEGPIGPAVWKIAWPTMLQNVIGGLQGVIDHAMVGHFVGYRANAA